MGPIALILVFLVLPLAAALFVLAALATTLALKGIAAVPAAVWGVVVALAVTGWVARRTFGRRAEMGSPGQEAG